VPRALAREDTLTYAPRARAARRWTDGSGVYHKHVTEVITFGNLAGALDALDAPTDGFDDLEVIDASGAVPAGEGGVEARLPLVPPPLAKGLKLTRAPF